MRSSQFDDEVILAEPAENAAESSVALEQPRRRMVFVPTVLFLATCFSAFLAGIYFWVPSILIESAAKGQWMIVRESILLRGWEGLVYMAAVVGILLTHEMGHFLMTLRYRVPSSLPFFLPMPFALFGTMGAVIAMDGRHANRKQIFDIGIAGPLAGLVIAVPVLLAGVAQADFTIPTGGGFRFGVPLFIHWLLEWIQPTGYNGQTEIWLSQMNPLLMAGWFGLLVTGLNMVPVSQLDGGHVVYTLFGPKGRWIARGFVFAAIAFITLTGAYIWTLMLVLVIVVLGIDHPPTSDDTVRLGAFRTVLGLTSLAIPFLSLPPTGLGFVD